MKKIPHLRWSIAGLLAAAIALNYLDRQNVPVVIGELNKTIRVTDQQYSQLQFMFLLAYGVMYAGGGKIMDVLGTRRGYTIMIVWWSLANLMIGTISSVFGLGFALFLLGLGEGGGFPGAAKAVSEWFPPNERSMAFGIFNTGSCLGAIIAPPLIVSIVLWSNWRWVFFVTGALGFIWAAVWLMLYNVPARHKFVTDGERDNVETALSTAQGSMSHVPWVGLFRYRQIWGLVTARFLSDSAWFFFIFWLPKYLGDVRHLNIKQIGYYAWIPYVGAGTGSLLGGWFSSYLMRRKLSIDASRKIALGIGAACMPASLLIASSPLAMAVVFFSMAMFGHQFWSAIVQTLAADMFPSQMVGSVSGMLGAAGSFGAMLFNLLIGALLTWHKSYAAVLIISGILHPLAFVIILLVVRRIEPVLRAQMPVRIAYA